MAKKTVWAFALVAGAIGTGCGSSPTTPDDPDPPRALLIESAGRLERGAHPRLTLIDTTTAGVDTGTDPATWSADPADAVEFVAVEEGEPSGAADPSDTAVTGQPLTSIEARLLRAGPVTITAKAGAAEGQIRLEVEPPPIIVLEMVRDGNRDIYRAALDGGDLVRLTSGQHDNRSPTVAGDHVVFVSFRDGNGELYSVPLAGGDETRLTETSADEADPALSPDGTRLAYTSAVTGVPKLWTAAADATDAARAAPEFGFSGALDAAPSWAPDGERLVFVSTASGTADLYIYTPATGTVEPLLGTDAPEVEPAWSPDGEWVAFASARGGQTDLYRVHVESGEVEQLTDRDETDARPTWLRDGRLVYMARIDGMARLRWLDPEEPDVVYDIPVGEGTIGRVSGVW